MNKLETKLLALNSQGTNHIAPVELEQLSWGVWRASAGGTCRRRRKQAAEEQAPGHALTSETFSSEAKRA